MDQINLMLTKIPFNFIQLLATLVLNQQNNDKLKKKQACMKRVTMYLLRNIATRFRVTIVAVGNTQCVIRVTVNNTKYRGVAQQCFYCKFISSAINEVFM
jgi:hypothetical protein